MPLVCSGLSATPLLLAPGGRDIQICEIWGEAEVSPGQVQTPALPLLCKPKRCASPPPTPSISIKREPVIAHLSGLGDFSWPGADPHLHLRIAGVWPHLGPSDPPTHPGPQSPGRCTSSTSPLKLGEREGDSSPPHWLQPPQGCSGES